MKKYIIIRVGDSHHGSLPPGLLILLPDDEVTWHDDLAMFTNPAGGGVSFGQMVGFINMELA
jgi:hypothetical protein